jgi:hypothetical protein
MTTSEEEGLREPPDQPSPGAFMGSSHRGMRVPQLEKIMGKQGTRRIYRIVARSELDDRYAWAFEGMHMETRDGRTILTGEAVDQSHLFGVLNRLNGLGLQLLSVQAMPDEDHEDRSSPERDREP